MKIEILESAQEDLTNGANFYESCEIGLGHYFLDSLFSDIDSLLIYAGVHEVSHFGLYRMLSNRFPFAIYYDIKDELIRIYAVLDTRRRPAWTHDKLAKSKIKYD